VLVIIGVKMLLPESIHVSTTLSLCIVGGIILISILASLLASWVEHSHQEKNRKTSLEL
jgi:predicted tellurium resistance membrane protein TerC